MRRTAKILAALAAGLLLLVVVFLLSFGWLLRKGIEVVASQRTGCPVTIGSLDLGLRDGTLHVRDLHIGNPEGFGETPLLRLPELYLAYDLDAAATNALRFREVRVHLDEVGMVIDPRGRTNLTELAAFLEDQERGRGGSTSRTNLLGDLTFGGIEQLTISLGRLNYHDQRAADIQRVVRLNITNRMITNVVSAEQLTPLWGEIVLKTLFQLRL